MKKTILSLFVALMATVAVQAQQISVVAEDGTTTFLYHTLQEAIEGASPNSVIYLPGGGFAISDDVKINKKLTIIGIGYDAKNDNVDGITTINGNLHFNEGSDGSAVMGCNITERYGGRIIIGDDRTAINNIMIKYCSIDYVFVKNSNSRGTIINQNYIRNSSEYGGAEVKITNNIIGGQIKSVGAGEISYNTFCYYGHYSSSTWAETLYGVSATVIGNIFRASDVGYIQWGCSCDFFGNYYIGGSFGDDPIMIDATEEEIFQNINEWKVTPASDFHFKDPYKVYESKVGIYAGSGFSKKGMAPVPYIVAKKIDEQTDVSGNLNVKIRVSAGE